MTDQGYKHSFEMLGYALTSPRQDWSAENESGVCLSMWSGEMRQENGLPIIDTKLRCGPIEHWLKKPGGKKRQKHLIKAWNDFDRWVDLVVRQGNSGEDNVPSNPWIVEKRKNHKWRLQTFDQETGHFSLTPELIDESAIAAQRG